MPRLVQVYTENNDFQHVEVLKRNRTKRQRYNEFFVEGVKAINSLVASNWEISSFIFTSRRPMSEWARQILANSRAHVHYDMHPDMLEKLSDKEETSELLAVVKMPDDDVSRLPVTEDLLLVVFDRPSSPGNLGSSIRSCDAFGATGVVITGHSVDLYHPHTIRGTMGSFFVSTMVRLESLKGLTPWIERASAELGEIQIVGSSAKADINVADFNFKKPTILLLGNETHGMSRAFEEICTAIVKIPMLGRASSLNISCALSILLFQARQSRSV